MRRLAVWIITFRQRRFNPRTREGCDHRCVDFHSYNPSFNPRTREGCDPILGFPAPIYCSFNPRTREGCDGDDDDWGD